MDRRYRLLRATFADRELAFEVNAGSLEVFGPRSDFPDTLPFAMKVEVPWGSFLVAHDNGQVEAVPGAWFTSTYEDEG